MVGGGVDGAVYVTGAPLAEVSGAIVPQSEAEHCSVQLTPRSFGSSLTVAVICTVDRAATFPDAEELTATWIAGTVSVVEAEIAALSAAVAVMVTVRSAAGAAGGALNVLAAPLAVVTGDTLPQGALGQETLHLTPALPGSLTSVAVTCVDEPAGTVLVARDSEIGLLATVICTLAVTEEPASALAVIVTVRSAAGAAAGAV